MDGLTIAEAAQTTGWSARMLRYIESLGLVEAARSGGGFRLYGPEQLQRLRTLRELLDSRELALGDVGVALRLRNDPDLRRAVEAWFESTPARPAGVAAPDWLRWEQEKHQLLLARAGQLAYVPYGSPRTEQAPNDRAPNDRALEPARPEHAPNEPAQPGHGPVKETA